MADVKNRLDEIEAGIMAGLKDFQCATVERIDKLFRDGQMRVLVSDEVGLGKTLIARGTVAKLAKLQKEQHDDLVKVVYICSNSAIADQNLTKLMISKDIQRESSVSSRLSMQHLNIFMQENDEDVLSSYVQLIPLTPETSFRMTSTMGTVGERALIYEFIRNNIDLIPYKAQLEIAMQGNAYANWGWYKYYYKKMVDECDERSYGEYRRYMKQKLDEELYAKDGDGMSCIDCLIDLCKRIKSNGNKRVPGNSAIGRLRVIFARISLDRLEPDLVIMDEFQRFKYLIDSHSESETGMLAKKFFGSTSVKMLLLSATPYKMYSTLEEIDETDTDEHYSEFLDVMEFLNGTDEENKKFREVWNNYSVKLKELTVGDTTILEAKNAAEDAMYSRVCRTERVSASDGADMIDAHEVKDPLSVSEQDIKSYIQAQNLLDETGLSYKVPVDYIKSTPYLLSFMKDYKLKRDIEKYFKDNPDEMGILNRETLWLKKQSFDRYEKIPAGNARLERVMSHVFKNSAERLLWVPPSKPYYTPGGAYKNAEHFSKTLIFSSWEMVPRMLAGMISYEAERKTVGALAKKQDNPDVRYFYSEKKRFPAARLNFSVSNDSPNAMTLFCLMYPSQFLANLYDPVDCMNKGLDLRDIEKEIGQKLTEKLLRFDSPKTGTEDKRWYYMAPLFFDGAGYVTTWLGRDADLSAYGDDEDEKTKKQKGFRTHLQALKELYRNGPKLGRMPDDLIEVLTTMAIASPAVCIYRTYKRYAGKSSIPNYMPSQVAKVFINRMNTPESTAVIELCYGKSDDAHWLNLLKYCKDGNMQAMFDEYAHLITNGLDCDEKLVELLHRTLVDSMIIRTTAYSVDTLKNFRTRMNGGKETAVNVRTHFAVSFTKGVGEKDADRKKTVRNAFNSPFRPFVLASTSIGQEGLDFHNYCRRIVHWNLPSNPIDLEQREGRINRFECLAIRQNVADRYGNVEFKDNVWAEMFDEAVRQEKTENGSDLIPFWGLREREDMVRIERIVPMYPFSRDGISYERLIKILSLYRLTLGQARQEELIEYIYNNFEDVRDVQKLFINLSPFYKNKSKEGK